MAEETRAWIKIYDDLAPGEFCDACVAAFERGPTLAFSESYRQCDRLPDLGGTALFAPLKAIMRSALDRYKLETGNRTLHFVRRIEDTNIYRYRPVSETAETTKDHFHKHADAWSVASATRQLSVILYLNDVEEGGGTVFEDLDVRVQPKRGRLLIFPSSFLFEHAGEPAISGPKYILVSWLHFDGATTYRTFPLTP